jgi:acyl-CoA synthetase (AMP-forming)/AMP-acid ligase II
MARASSLPASLLAAARTTPSATFLEVWDERDDAIVRVVTFADLAAHMLATAALLRDEAHVTAGSRVAVLAPNSVAYICFVFGTMALGAASVHLDTRQPEATTRALLDGLHPRVLCAAEPHATSIRATCASLSLQLLPIANAHEPPCQPLATAAASILAASVERLDGARTIAAVFFTGGTTGIPKAVPHTHAGLLWLCGALQRAHSFALKPAFDAAAQGNTHGSRAGAVNSAIDASAGAGACIASTRALDGGSSGVRTSTAGTVCFTPYSHVRRIPDGRT